MYRKVSEETRQTAKAMLKAGKWVYEVAKALDSRLRGNDGGRSWNDRLHKGRKPRQLARHSH